MKNIKGQVSGTKNMITVLVYFYVSFHVGHPVCSMLQIISFHFKPYLFVTVTQKHTQKNLYNKSSKKKVVSSIKIEVVLFSFVLH